MATITQADDTLISRNRLTRAAVFFGMPILLTVLLGNLFGYLAETFLADSRFFWIGFVAGAGGGLVFFLAMKHIFIVQNDTTGLLVTLDQLKSLVGRTPHVVYGPGTHFSFPWEARFAKNYIPVEEVAEGFSFTAICQDGTVTGSGSFRLRPDFNNPINYLSGVGAFGNDLKDLLIAFITDWLAKRTMNNANLEKEELNLDLKEKFVGMSEFEKRFGVQVGDITVSVLRLSDDVGKTRNALNEAQVVAQGTAILLGFSNVADMQAAVAAKTITQDDVDHARREFRIISGNMDGASINRYEVDIKGLSPETAAAISSFLQNPASAQINKSLGGRKPTNPESKS